MQSGKSFYLFLLPSFPLYFKGFVVYQPLVKNNILQIVLNIIKNFINLKTYSEKADDEETN
jgi:hypothetical protein